MVNIDLNMLEWIFYNSIGVLWYFNDYIIKIRCNKLASYTNWLYLFICDRPEQKQALDQFAEDWNKITVSFILQRLGSLTTSDAELIQKYVKFWTPSRRKVTVETVKRLHLYWYSNFPGAFTHVIFIAT